MGLALHVGLHAAGGEERVAILVKVADLAGEVVIKVLTEHYAGGKPVADSGLGLAARRVDASVAVNPVADCAADFGVRP